MASRRARVRRVVAPVAFKLWGTEEGGSRVSVQIRRLSELTARRSFLTVTPCLPSFAFDVEGRFSRRPFVTGLRNVWLYRGGHCRAEIDLSLQTLALPSERLRRVLGAVLVEAAERVAEDLKDRWPDFEAKKLLQAVGSAVEEFVSEPDTVPEATVEEWEDGGFDLRAALCAMEDGTWTSVASDYRRK